jgi:hypothetical protein
MKSYGMQVEPTHVLTFKGPAKGCTDYQRWHELDDAWFRRPKFDKALMTEIHLHYKLGFHGCIEYPRLSPCPGAGSKEVDLYGRVRHAVLIEAFSCRATVEFLGSIVGNTQTDNATRISIILSSSRETIRKTQVFYGVRSSSLSDLTAYLVLFQMLKVA